MKVRGDITSAVADDCSGNYSYSVCDRNVASPTSSRHSISAAPRDTVCQCRLCCGAVAAAHASMRHARSCDNDRGDEAFRSETIADAAATAAAFKLGSGQFHKVTNLRPKQLKSSAFSFIIHD